MVAWSNKKPAQNPVPPDYVDPEGFGPDAYVGQDQISGVPIPPDGAVRPLAKKMDVLPYRGQEYHGVNPNLAGPPPDINADVFDQTGVIPESQQAPERHEVPVPVRIVTEGDDWEQTYTRTTGLVLSNVPITIISHMQTRTNLVVTNNGAVAVFISSEQQPSQPNSVSVPAGGSFSTKGTNRLYAVSSDGSAQSISILEEYVVSSKRKPAF